MSESLRSRTVRALSWSLVETVGLRAVQFIVGIILARVLFPEQFGLIGMLTIFMAVSQSFLDSGFGAALIQKREATPVDASSIFYFNIIVGLAASGILCLAAPWIAGFYNQPVLIPLTRAMSLIIVINSFALIQTTLLSKQIDFKKRTKVSMIATVTSGGLGITMAINGFGVWSLVAQQISSALVRSFCLWIFSSWRPIKVFSLASLRGMFGFGSKMLVSGLLYQVFENAYYLVIGKLFSAGDLGVFTRAKSLQGIPSQTLSEMVGKVAFPVFSTIQDDPARVKRGLKKSLSYLVLINFPMMVGMAVVARPLVLVLLTEKWAAVVPYLQIFCGVGFLYPLQLMNLSILKALGRSDLFLRLEIIKKVFIVINIAITWRFGISAMIYGMVVGSVISYFLNSYYTGILIGYPVREQVRDLIPYLLMAGLMGIAVYAAGLIPYAGPLSTLLAQVATGIILYPMLIKMFARDVFEEIKNEEWGRIGLLEPKA